METLSCTSPDTAPGMPLYVWKDVLVWVELTKGVWDTDGYPQTSSWRDAPPDNGNKFVWKQDTPPELREWGTTFVNMLGRPFSDIGVSSEEFADWLSTQPVPCQQLLLTFTRNEDVLHACALPYDTRKWWLPVVSSNQYTPSSTLDYIADLVFEGKQKKLRVENETVWLIRNIADNPNTSVNTLYFLYRWALSPSRVDVHNRRYILSAVLSHPNTPSKVRRSFLKDILPRVPADEAGSTESVVGYLDDIRTDGLVTPHLAGKALAASHLSTDTMMYIRGLGEQLHPAYHELVRQCSDSTHNAEHA